MHVDPTLSHYHKRIGLHDCIVVNSGDHLLQPPPSDDDLAKCRHWPDGQWAHEGVIKTRYNSHSCTSDFTHSQQEARSIHEFRTRL